MAMVHADIGKVCDLTTGKVSVHTTRRMFKREETSEELAFDVDEYFVEKIVDHEERGRNPKN